MLASNYHTHSRYCDGAGELQSFIEQALRQGLASIGFSSHAPLPFATTWTMPLVRLPQYLAEIERLRIAYAPRLEVYAGLELDFAPGVQHFQQEHILGLSFDYLIGSVHFLGFEPAHQPWTADGPAPLFEQGLREGYDGDIRRMVCEYYARIRAMVLAGHIDVVGHLDRILYNNPRDKYFTQEALWYREAVEETLQTIAARDTLLELNAAGWFAPLGSPNPAPWIVRRCRELGIRFTYGADAHRPEHVARGLERAAQLLRECGYGETWCLSVGQWTPCPL
jgi:histidinol-phosphatase (PHP family)